ncbi:hypothetical protein JCGZ_07240 [Jatropha curcas]|uniref:MADS-box domain-containing protein n=1 Tax=Jatropha curcas TaxID=180498 RepID=A0A067KPF8_JATCU|nr:agamous-like MADS-box protein MADS1 [Jatropha curcas]KDP33669.1 hypothetical protein JCGZ_07240 [Jatropha curcas]
MGRGKLSMKLITNERSRMVTYQKRKKGLTKKLHEFRVLCDVDACVIIFGPKFSNRPIDVDTCPTDHSEIKKIIDRYKSHGNDRKKSQDLSHFFETRKRKLDDEITKMHRACLEAKFPTWDNRLNSSELEELCLLHTVLQSKLETAMSRILKIKGDNYLMIGEDSKSVNIIQGSSSNNNINNRYNSMASTFANALQQKCTELQQPFDHHQVLPFNVNPLNSPMMMMMMMKANGTDLSQFGAQEADQTAGNMVILNNHNGGIPHPVSYCGEMRQLSLLGSGQGSIMPNVSSQMQVPQFSEFCDTNEFEMKNMKRQCLEYFKY